MESELNQCYDEDLKTTPEKPQFSPVPSEKTDEIRSDSNTVEVKNEPSDVVGDIENIQTKIVANADPNTVTAQFSVCSQIFSDTDLEILPSNVPVKKELISDDIDYNVPISKTPLSTSVVQNSPNSETNERLEGNTYVVAQKDKEDEINLNEYSSKADLDKFLDGLATPIAPVMPRLRVKTEFSLQNTQQRDKESVTVNTEILAPPPPTSTFSSTSNSDLVTDGIATPRLSLASINRLRVKTEFAFPQPTPQHNEVESSFPKDYFDDIIGSETLDKEAGEISPSISDDEAIPNDFFDDLLHDKLKERIQEAQNCDIEEKYSDRLKEYERLKAEEKLKEKRKNRKKQKKSKKKSRKRSRSRSMSPNSATKTREVYDSSGPPHHDRNKRSRISPPRNEMASSSIFSRLDGGFRIKSEFPTKDVDNNTAESVPILENEEEEVLTPKEKQDRAIKRAAALLNYLQIKSSEQNSSVFSTFSFISTVRKLPTSHSYVQQQVYENRSPLHTVNNVSYKFNSHTTRFNMEEWGLAALTPYAAKLAKVVGCDAQFIHNKLKAIKIPAKLKKIKQEPNIEGENEEEEALIETNSSLYSNAMTQTDDSGQFDKLHKEKGYEIGVQVEPSTYSIGCQTLETQSPTENLHKDDEAPIMKIIRDLNENQLMAIHAFAEFIKEPNTNANAMEMYKIQMKILDIYKISQIPSVLAGTQAPIVNNYTTLTSRTKGPSQLRIQSVKGADGKQFSVNDPRANSETYYKRMSNEDAGSSSNYDSRYSRAAHSRPNEDFSHSSHSRPMGGNGGRHYYSSNNSPSRPLQSSAADCNQASLPTSKHYGRGGLRR